MFNIQIFKKHARSSAILWTILMILPAIFIDLMVLIIVNNTKAGQVATVNMALSAGIFMSLGYELPLIFIIVTANKLVASEVQSGAITYVVASPVSRSEIIQTKMYFLIGSIIAGFLLNLIISLPVIAMNKDKIDITVGAFIVQLIGLFLLLFMTSSIGFIASAYFNKCIWSFCVGAGVPIAFFVLSVLSSSVADLDKLKYISLNTLFDSGKSVLHNTLEGQYGPNNMPLSGVGQYELAGAGHWVGQYIAMILIGAGLYAGSGVIFCKKDLPL